MPYNIDPAELAARLPDEPGWIDTRGMLLSGRCQVLGRDPEEGYVVLAADWSVAAIVGRPDPSLVNEAARHYGGMMVNFILRPEGERWVRPLLPGWRRRRVILHALEGEPRAVAGSADVRRFTATSSPPLDHLPPELRREIRLAMGLGASAPRAPARAAPRLGAGGLASPVSIAAVFVDGLAVSFCYPVWQTERLWDVAVDTLKDYRGRGCAAHATLAMIAHMSKRRRSPVWGALDDNQPSLRLAARLGFKPADALVMLTSPDEPSSAQAGPPT